MKRIAIVIAGLFCIFGLIALWCANQPPPEVIKIYTAVPYAPKMSHTPAAEDVRSAYTAPSETAPLTAAGAGDDPIAGDSTSPEEYSAFLDWLDALEGELSMATLTEEPEDVAAPEAETPTELPYWELRKMVKDAYDMESVLNEYGIYVDENNRAVCPKCTGYDFYLLESRTSGHDEWCCLDCEYPGGDVIEFVAWIEGVEETEAARYLAERAGLLK